MCFLVSILIYVVKTTEFDLQISKTPSPRTVCAARGANPPPSIRRTTEFHKLRRVADVLTNPAAHAANSAAHGFRCARAESGGTCTIPAEASGAAEVRRRLTGKYSLHGEERSSDGKVGGAHRNPRPRHPQISANSSCKIAQAVIK